MVVPAYARPGMGSTVEFDRCGQRMTPLGEPVFFAGAKHFKK
jgi:hypothetical protein